MTQRSKSQYAALYGSSGTVFPDNTTGEISESDMRQFGEDQKDSFAFIGGVEASAANYNSGSILVNASDSDERQLRFLFLKAGPVTSGNQDLVGTALMPEDSVLTCQIHGQGIAVGGAEGISVVKVLSMRRDGSGTPVAIGTETSLHNVEDSGSTPTIVLSVNSGNLRVAVNSGSGTQYHWTVWATISIGKI